MAQAPLTLRAFLPDSSSYPQISAFLDVRNEQNEFVFHLRPDQVAVFEEGKTLAPDAVELVHPGVQLVVAINPGPSFAIRNFKAVSRYDIIKAALSSWAKTRAGSTTDDLSLLITNGQSISHVSNSTKWLSSLEEDAVDPRSAKSSIDTLARAIALASDPTPRPGMGRVVLFITSSIDGNLEQAIQDLSRQARQQDIIIHLWLVASSGALLTRSSEQLNALAGASGGQVFQFGGDEALPDLESLLESERQIYRITYQSLVGLSGEHEFSFQVQAGDELAQSNPVTFKVELLPPEPAFVSPPIVIERRLPTEVENADLSMKNDWDIGRLLTPKTTMLQVVFDFPDGQKRELKQSALIVDGQIVGENHSPPFEQFNWNLESYQTDGVHQIQVQATDVLGLSGTSIEVPVKISVERFEADPYYFIRRNLPIISSILAVLAGALLFLVLILGGKMRPRSQALAIGNPKPNLQIPLTNASQGSASRNRLSWMSRNQHPCSSHSTNALAYLQRIAEEGRKPIGPPIPIIQAETTLGSDAAHANFIIEDPCIEKLHARLACLPDGDFLLFDMGSIAGTWVNYQPVSTKGIKLQHGDIVHIGQIGYLFSLHERLHVLKPTVKLGEAVEPVLQKENESEESEERT